MTEHRPRGICCHEAGHAVVARSFALPVITVRVTCSEAKGWYGGTDIPKGSDDHLHWTDKVTILVAGRTAEKVFNCPAHETHETAWLHDLWQISVLLNATGIPEKEHWARINEASERAQPILETHREKALKLIDRIAECGHVDRAEFQRLMNG